jgi:hypothetical protein
MLLCVSAKPKENLYVTIYHRHGVSNNTLHLRWQANAVPCLNARAAYVQPFKVFLLS